MKNYYNILGVTQQMSTEQIKKAYRKLAKQYHPDVVKDDKAAQERMYQIQEAFECLGNEERRKAYDEALERKARDGMPSPKKKNRNAEFSGQINPDMSQFERFFGFQAGKGMETYRNGQAKKPEGPIKPEEMFAAYFGNMNHGGDRK